MLLKDYLGVFYISKFYAMNNVIPMKNASESQLTEVLERIALDLQTLKECTCLVIRNIISGNQSIDDIRNIYAAFAQQCICRLREQDVI